MEMNPVIHQHSFCILMRSINVYLPWIHNFMELFSYWEAKTQKSNEKSIRRRQRFVASHVAKL